MPRYLILGFVIWTLAGCSTGEILVADGVEARRENFTPPKKDSKPPAPPKTGYLLSPDRMIPKTVVCEVNGDQRQIEMRIKERGCELIYTKAGQDNIVATSTTGTANCSKVQNRIRENLSASGFGCR